MDFRWNDWNLEHATCHGVTVEEIEEIGRIARPPYPEDIGDEKLLVIGRGQGGRWIQIIYTLDADGTIYVIHARPLTDVEKRRYRRRMK